LLQLIVSGAFDEIFEANNIQIVGPPDEILSQWQQMIQSLPSDDLEGSNVIKGSVEAVANAIGSNAHQLAALRLGATVETSKGTFRLIWVSKPSEKKNVVVIREK
jgi:hypothetical protein